MLVLGWHDIRVGWHDIRGLTWHLDFTEAIADWNIFCPHHITASVSGCTFSLPAFLPNSTDQHPEVSPSSTWGCRRAVCEGKTGQQDGDSQHTS